MKIDKHIEIVRSGTSSLSSMGQKSSDMICEVLRRHYRHVGETLVSSTQDLTALVQKRPDLVFLGMKNIPLEPLSPVKIWLSTYLEENGLTCTGSDGPAIALDFDKSAAKQVVQGSGLNTAAYFMALPGQYGRKEELPLVLPLFIKPPNGGGGKGIGADSVVRDFAAYEQKVRSVATTFGTGALVETYLPGREFSVAVLGEFGSDKLTAMPIELITERNLNGDRILGQKVKAADTEHAVAVHDAYIKHNVSELAVNVFKSLGARDYGRIDIRLNERGVPYFLEANLVPGVAKHDFISYFTSACQINQNINYDDMILKIVELGLSRQEITTPETELYDASLELAFEG